VRKLGRFTAPDCRSVGQAWAGGAGFEEINLALLDGGQPPPNSRERCDA
jgi:hypothetical protein